MQFHSFDASYVESLCAGDARTQEHFVAYFGELLKIKIRSRLRSAQDREDARQDTLVRVLAAVCKERKLRQPERLGAFVNSVCNNVLFEKYRELSNNASLDDPEHPEPKAEGADALDKAMQEQLKEKVREILLEMPLRDRSLLKAVFLDERDRKEVCEEFHVDPGYLRVLLYRAKLLFKEKYTDPDFTGPDASGR